MDRKPSENPEIGGDAPGAHGRTQSAESLVGVPIGAADRVANPGKAERVASGEEGEEQDDTTSDPATMEAPAPSPANPLADGGLKDKAALESDKRANAVGATEKVQPNQPGKPAR